MYMSNSGSIEEKEPKLKRSRDNDMVPTISVCCLSRITQQKKSKDMSGCGLYFIVHFGTFGMKAIKIKKKR